VGCSAPTLDARWRKPGLRPYRVGNHNICRVSDFETGWRPSKCRSVVIVPFDTEDAARGHLAEHEGGYPMRREVTGSVELSAMPPSMDATV
jgi:hypothetical protein